MCRTEFGTFEEEEPSPRYILMPPGGLGQTFMFDEIDAAFRRNVRDEYDAINAAVPIEEFTGEIEDRDIDLVLRHAERVSRASVEAYLRHFHGDIVETIMFLVYHKKMPIPDFRERERPPLAEAYVSPVVAGRVTSSRRAEADRGYESS